MLRQVHEAGLRVETTLDLDLQKAANRAVLEGLATYERRHGWKGKLENMLANGTALDRLQASRLGNCKWSRRLRSCSGDARPCLLKSTRALAQRKIVLLPADWQWTGQHFSDPLVKPGDMIYVRLSDAMEAGAQRASLEQDAGVQGALMAMDNTSGDVLAMVGGRDFALSSSTARRKQSGRQDQASSPTSTQPPSKMARSRQTSSWMRR